MTGPVTTEALVEALAQTLWQQSHAFLQEAAWEEALQKAEAIPDGRAANSVAAVRSKAAEIVTEHFAPLLAALQQVTAERDEARDALARMTYTDEAGTVWKPVPGWQSYTLNRKITAAEASLATATSELARLRAEGEAKDRALKLLLVFVDCAGGEGIILGGGSYGIPDTDAADLCVDVAKALGIEFAGPEYMALIEQGQRLHTALARAATAREGA